MPYKDIKKAREAARRFRQRHPNKKRLRASIQAQAIYCYPKREQCSVDGCNGLGERHHPDYTKPKEIVWLCKTHHEKEHHKIIKPCSFSGCLLKHAAKGYCNRHYKKWIRGVLNSLP